MSFGRGIAIKAGQVSNSGEIEVDTMFSRIKAMLLVAGLALVALIGLAQVSQQSRNSVRTVASAVWGS
jgi:hypothetical protein